MLRQEGRAPSGGLGDRLETVPNRLSGGRYEVKSLEGGWQTELAVDVPRRPCALRTAGASRHLVRMNPESRPRWLKVIDVIFLSVIHPVIAHKLSGTRSIDSNRVHGCGTCQLVKTPSNNFPGFAHQFSS